MEFQKVRQVQTLILFTLLCSGYKCDIDVWQGEWSHERWRFICHCNCVVFVFTIIWVDTSWNLPLDWRKQLPYLPVYNVHPCIMCTCFQKKSVSTLFLSKNNYLEKFSRNVKFSSTCMKISYRSWCKSFNVLSVQWYIKFYMTFSLFSSAVLLLHDRTWSICTTPGKNFWTRSSGTRLVATW